jgi:2-polyprenyl-6-methoxyphenol hydroxylase-like FAD-dependent oxidoreductase
VDVLISGAGIAGPTLAYWLLEYGMKPTVVERAPTLRTGGYVIDFWGAGFEIADRMGLSQAIKNCGYQIEEVRIVNRCGERVAGFPAATFARLTQGRYTSLPRGALASAILGSIEGKCEIILNDSVSAIEQSGSMVDVTFESGRKRNFDLVVGADGVVSENSICIDLQGIADRAVHCR